MSISFSGIPDTVRTPGAHAEIDGSRALQGLAANPHKVLILGTRLSEGTIAAETLVAISSDNLADGYFGSGSVLARMCNVFKDNNPNTELYAMALSIGAGVKASGAVDFSLAVRDSPVSGTGTYYLMINGSEYQVTINSGDTVSTIVSAAEDLINANSQAPVEAAQTAASAGRLSICAIASGTEGNYINIRANYYTGQSRPDAVFSTAPTISIMNGGTTEPDLGDAWAIIDNERFNYIIQPYTTTANLTEIEDELEDRFGPLIGQQGHGFTAARVSSLASATTMGNARNCEFNTIMAAYDSPSDPIEWAAALGAKAAFNLNQDPARPLHFLKLKGILPPPAENRFTRAERDVLLYDGIATYRVDSGGSVLIDRCITTYQKNALDVIDPTYLDVTTMATLGEIRDQWLTRMSTRFLSPRFKLADDGFPVQPGSYVATPSIVKQEIIALFTALRDKGYIENLDDFIENLIVERDLTDRNRINTLLPCDLINQFRVIAGKIQFIL